VADAVLVRTPKAVLAALQAAPDGTFLEKLQPERSYADWEEPLTDSGVLKVDVVAVSVLPSELATRGSIIYAPGVDIVVRKKFDESAHRESDGRIKLEEIDALVLLVQQIDAFFTAKHLSGADDGAWEKSNILAAYKPSHLRLHHQFTGIVRITFETENALT
jgi:hypothetical protein